MIPRIRTGLLALFTFLSCISTVLAQGANETESGGSRWITYQSPEGETVYLQDNRKPSLYTQNFGDCLGGSSINVTRFDAAYYQDNMTVLFHLAGNSGIANDSLMMYIGVYAYGEDRFDLVFNPCNANIYSLCPINSSVPITASGIIPVAPSDVANIPAIALTIPDFEGEAILRIFSNTSHEEIACYSAVVTNGGSFGQPESVGSVLGVFTFVAMIASFATAIYGEAVPTMRLHYAHSLSVGVVFSVWQHIFFTGALSVNWPSVLVAWWSNFAWAGGMIYTSSMQSSINNLIGHNTGNTSQVGAAQAGSPNSGVGGGYDISSIYKRALSGGLERAANHPLFRDIASEIYNRDPRSVLKRDLVRRTAEGALRRRDNTIADASEGYHWYGHPVKNGLPLPGNYSGFAGTLAEEGIAVSNAFMTGFLWFLILLVIVVAAVMIFKWALEALASIKWIKQDRLKFFRDHWLGYSGIVALRTCFIGWFMMMFLTIFQFTYDSSGGVKGIAAIVFIIFFLGLPSISAYAVWYKWNVTDYNEGPRSERNKLLAGRLPIPRFGLKKSSHTTVESIEQGANEDKAGSKPIWKRMASAGTLNNIMDREGNIRSIHDDEDYTKKFGWLASRFRRTRWWFFTAWLFYTFLEAIFYGGASGYAQAQVFGLLVVEFLAFCFIIWAKPFEGQRLNLLVVYCLGFSKVTSVALSAAFDVQFNLGRITTTVIGIVIIVIQGILTIITMIAIIIGAISSYMSVSRNKEDFRPRKWHGLRERYFNHLDRTVNDLPREPKPKKQPPPPPEEPKYGFEMKNVRRLNKIEDEDGDFVSEMRSFDPNASYMSVNEEAPSTPGFGTRSGNGTPVNRSRANSRAASVASMSQTNLPYGARQHRPSWNQRDFTPVDTHVPDRNSTPIDMERNVPEDDPARPPSAKGMRTPSRSATMPINLKPQTSVDSLRVGGDVSTRDTIGNVPAPSVRPRAGSYGYNRSAARSISDSNRNSDYLSDLPDSRPGSQRASLIGGGPSGSYGRHHPLTPAQEMDEWTLTKTNSRQ
ncbi:hypothetical protein PRZ48_002525 [Zasmidium cellare]|uniref:ML-like domain-containing protein n=1 Tax=Zasmidium cellare TaxID=395010 RepID=A0ABR0F4B4_ZASCE|nr:hypothetical protein PRZ48_002525 [Zasmidium cellare]